MKNNSNKFVVPGAKQAIEKMKYEIEQTDEIISNNTGLVLVNNIMESTNFKQKINNKNYLKVQSREITNKDIFMSYIGILAQGRTEFERADEYRKNQYFKQALDIEKSPSCSILRQRFNAIGEIESNLKDMKKLIDAGQGDFAALLNAQVLEIRPTSLHTWFMLNDVAPEELVRLHEAYDAFREAERSMGPVMG